MNSSLSDFLNDGLRAHREKRLDDAERAYLQALEQVPDNFDALQLLGMLRHQQGRIAEATRLLENALAAKPGHPGALNHLSAILLAGGKPAEAADKALAVLATTPGSALALYNLGSAQRVLGQAEAAAAALTQSLAIDRSSAETTNLLGIVRHEQGRYVEAAGHFKTALLLCPGHPEYLNNLGFALLEAGRPGDARPCLEAAIAARPAFGEALVNLGRALHELGLDPQAIEVLDAARKINPLVAAVPINLGVSLQALNRSLEAERAFLAALDIQPENVAGLANLAALYESSNRLELAAQTVHRGLSLDPDDPFLNLVAARCERRGGELAHAGKRVQRALAAQPGDRWSQALLYELARIEDRAENFASSMAAATAANRLALADWQGPGASGNPYNQMLARLYDATMGNWIEDWPPLSETSPDAAPVFLVGFPRSGTTLLDAIVGSHADFAVLEEKPALENLRRTLDRQAGGFIPALARLDEAGRSSLVARYWRDVEDLLDQALGNRRLLDKLPLNILLLPLIKRVFPGARVIMALRHPADVCLSCFFQEFDYRRAPAMANFLTLQDTVDFYGQVFSLWRLYAEKLSLNVHTVRYEDLVTDQEGETRRLFDFLGSDWDPRVLDYHLGVRERGTIDTPSYHQVSQPIYTQARYRWRHYAAELAPWLDTLHDWAEQLGYQRPPASQASGQDHVR